MTRSYRLKLACISLYGFSSGLPFLLILSTLHIWLKECGYSNSLIGTLVFITLPYSFKFILAPLLNQMPPPLLGKHFGHYKGWILWSQIAIMLSLFGMASIAPEHHILVIISFAFLTALFSAIQDIYIEAYRINILDARNLSMGTGLSSAGYRTGMWVSGAGALYLASLYSWQVSYKVMALLMGVGIITTLVSPTIHPAQRLKKWGSKQLTIKGIIDNYRHLFKSLRTWRQVMGIILGFKIIDSFLNVMTAPFMIDIGFDKVDIATVGKSLGIGAMIIGGISCGLMLRRFEIVPMFLLCAGLQVISSLLCIIQNKYGADLNFLYISMGFEHFASGAAATIFITYLSIISRQHQTAVLYTFLTSFSSLARILFSNLAGLTVDLVDWDLFFIIIVGLCTGFAGLILYLHHIKKHFVTLKL